jgi:hypothetical protein
VDPLPCGPHVEYHSAAAAASPPPFPYADGWRGSLRACLPRPNPALWVQQATLLSHHYSTAKTTLLTPPTGRLGDAAPGAEGGEHSWTAMVEGRQLAFVRVRLCRGDVLYVPPGWWHAVEARPH